MKRKILVFGCCLLALFATACNRVPKLKNGEEVVASIDGKKFTADDLYKELRATYGHDTLLTMVDRYIVEQEVATTKEVEEYAAGVLEFYKAYAESLEMDFIQFLGYIGLTGIKTEKAFLDYVTIDYKTSIAIRTQIGTTFTDKDIERYYNEKYSELLTVRSIRIAFAKDDEDGSAALKKANDIIAELKKTDKAKLEEKFIELANKNSANSSTSGGLISNFMSSEIDKALWDAAYNLKDGEYTATAVKTDDGYNIILRKSIASKPALVNSKQAIIDSLTTEILNENEYAKYSAMVELRKKYKLDIYDTGINSTYEDFLKLLDKTQQ